MGNLQERINYALDYFKSHGWTYNQAAGIVANLQAESKVNPTQAQFNGGPGYGLAQWENPRQRLFKQIYGKDIHGSSLEDQLSFIQYELINTEAEAGRKLKATKTAGEAGASVCRFYERPADTEGQAKYRCQLAEEIAESYNKFKNVIAGAESTAPKKA